MRLKHHGRRRVGEYFHFSCIAGRRYLFEFSIRRFDDGDLRRVEVSGMQASGRLR